MEGRKEDSNAAGSKASAIMFDTHEEQAISKHIKTYPPLPKSAHSSSTRMKSASRVKSAKGGGAISRSRRKDQEIKDLKLKIRYLEFRNSYLENSDRKLAARIEELEQEKQNVTRVKFRGTQTRTADFEEDSIEFSDDEVLEISPKDWLSNLNAAQQSKLRCQGLSSRKTQKMVDAEQRGELASYLRQLNRKYERRKITLNKNKSQKKNSSSMATSSLKTIAKLQPVDEAQVPESVKFAFQNIIKLQQASSKP